MANWVSFATTLEQYKILNQFKQNQNKIDKPILSDDQLNDLNDTLIFKMYHNPSIRITIFC